MSTAEHTDALTRRIEQLAAAALDEGDGAALAALIAALRSEIGAVRVDVGSLRSETGGLRTDLDGLEERLVAAVDAGNRETTGLLRRFAGELDETVTAALDDAAQATTATGSSVEDARGVLESRLAVLEDALDGVSERLEALARDGATTTTSHLRDLAATVRQLDTRLTAALDAARDRAAEDRAAIEQLADTAGSRLSTMTEVLDRALSGLQGAVGEQQAGVAALSARIAGLGEELAGRVADLTTVVDERTAALRTDVTERLEQLESAMGTFRTEWPTRTFEVVQGAKAVAEGVTREVRAQVEVQLDRVRDELARGVEEVGQARDGLDAQSSRLADAGRVLVAYLEQRDRLLEAERDRVLHDVLDSFATGLSSRERTALASRMGDAVARRRDARDAERYRAALSGSPPPGADAGLPPELTLIEADDVVRALSGRAPHSPAQELSEETSQDAREPAGPPEPLRSVHPPSTARGALAPPAASGSTEPPGVRTLSVTRTPHPGGSVVPPPKGRRATGTGAPGKAAAPGPARKAPTRTPSASTAPARRAPARKAPDGGSAASPTGSGDRGRLSVMPEVPSVDVALDLGDPVPPEVPDAEPSPPPAPPARAETHAGAERPPAEGPDDPSRGEPHPDDDDDGVRRMFRRRPRP